MVSLLIDDAAFRFVEVQAGASRLVHWRARRVHVVPCRNLRACGREEQERQKGRDCADKPSGMSFGSDLIKQGHFLRFSWSVLTVCLPLDHGHSMALAMGAAAHDRRLLSFVMSQKRVLFCVIRVDSLDHDKRHARMVVVGAPEGALTMT